MKKKKDNFDWIAIGVLAGVALVIVAICIIVTVIPRERSSKAQKVDLNCVTELKKNPLKECGE